MRLRNAVLTSLAVQAVLATPAWAHPGSGPHVHPEELIALVVFAVIAIIALRRARTPR